MLKLSAILVFLLSFANASIAMLTYPQFDGLVSYSEGIVVRHEATQSEKSKHVVYDSSGDLIKLLDFRVDGKPFDEPIHAISSDGRFWFVAHKTNEEFDIIATRILVFDQNQKLQ